MLIPKSQNEAFVYHKALIYFKLSLKISVFDASATFFIKRKVFKQLKTSLEAYFFLTRF